MFVRVNQQRNKDGSVRQYLQVIEAIRVNGKPRQRVIATIGRWDQPEGRARVDAILEALSQFADKLTVLNLQKDLRGEGGLTWGPVLVFRRLWEELGLARLWGWLWEETQVEFDLPEAVFAMVLNRLLDPPSRKSLVDEWLPTIWEPRFASLKLHHFYRALTYVHRFAHRVEDFLFARFTDLFNQDLELVLWDTTTVRFEGRGPEKLAQFGNAKDKRTDRRQMVVGVLLTRDGWPLAHAVYPGNLNDVTATLAIIGQLKHRFAFQKVLFVADRGAVGRRTLEALEQAGFEYIVGMRMRRVRVVRDEVIGCPGRYRVVSPALKVKEVVREGRRYILAYNPEAAEHDRQVREEVVARLRQALKEGSAGDLIRHSRYRRYLTIHRDAVEINEAAIEADARYDGKFVVLTNTNRDAAEVAQSYTHDPPSRPFLKVSLQVHAEAARAPRVARLAFPPDDAGRSRMRPTRSASQAITCAVGYGTAFWSSTDSLAA
ncbi:IS1634 family transposase [Geochorda subterranea]|uniref:IS1634 family transposase n=1 Tax=Geochorda subterranea TaxID=3109564 RepID=A0ABZ1BPQ3_9FIRM|nr:IS1634 family transposase [Limnochorda sp. LNt]WRP14526.1 IS1634 family transposase [Limnochorda sp. LNt]